MDRAMLNVILAKFWDAFKQKNPEVATLITIVGMGVIGTLLFGKELGLELPETINKVVVVITSLFLSFNNPSTFKILNPDTPEEVSTNSTENE